MGLILSEDIPIYTKITCSFCCKKLQMLDEVKLLEIHQVSFTENGIQSKVVTDEKGDYALKPLFLHDTCWGDIIDEVLENSKDRKPTASEDVLLICIVCESDISNNDYYVLQTDGQIQIQKRLLNGAHFEPSHISRHVCLECISTVIEEYLDDWEDLPDLLPIERFNFEGDEDE